MMNRECRTNACTFSFLLDLVVVFPKRTNGNLGRKRNTLNQFKDLVKKNTREALPTRVVHTLHWHGTRGTRLYQGLRI